MLGLSKSAEGKKKKKGYHWFARSRVDWTLGFQYDMMHTFDLSSIDHGIAQTLGFMYHLQCTTSLYPSSIELSGIWMNTCHTGSIEQESIVYRSKSWIVLNFSHLGLNFTLTQPYSKPKHYNPNTMFWQMNMPTHLKPNTMSFLGATYSCR